MATMLLHDPPMQQLPLAITNRALRCSPIRFCHQRQHLDPLKSTLPGSFFRYGSFRLLHVTEIEFLSWRDKQSSQARSLVIARNKTADDARDGAAAAPLQKQRRIAHTGRWRWGLAAAVAVSILFLSMALKKAASSLSSFQSSGGGVSFTFSVFGRNIALAERTPGWIYFLLLMAAGFGLFISEEALCVWVGATLARTLTWTSRDALLVSVSENTAYIVSTILWVYWGVCISDMAPFYAGKLAAQSRSSENFRKKLGINQEKLDGIMKTVQRYGNLIGFVERFSIGARNPTSFLAGASGIAPAKFFAGVCLGGLCTLPIQLSVGCLLRERPVAALAGVAAFVGIWTIVPYVTAALFSFFYFTTSNQQTQ